MNQVYSIVMMAAVAFVLTAQTAYGVGVDVLKNGTLVANNSPPRPPTNSTTGFPGNMTDPPTIIFYPDQWFDKHHSAAWKAGFSQGFLGVNLANKTHTQAFFQGYANGSRQFWWVKGYAYGISGKQGGLPNYRTQYGEGNDLRKQFHWGNTSGATDRIDMQNAYDNNWGPHSQDLSPMPVNTTDHHMSYYVGFENGNRAEGANSNLTKAIITSSNGWYESGCSGDKGWVWNGHLQTNVHVINEYCTGFKAGWNEAKISDNSD